MPKKPLKQDVCLCRTWSGLGSKCYERFLCLSKKRRKSHFSFILISVGSQRRLTKTFFKVNFVQIPIEESSNA